MSKDAPLTNITDSTENDEALGAILATPRENVDLPRTHGQVVYGPGNPPKREPELNYESNLRRRFRPQGSPPRLGLQTPESHNITDVQIMLRAYMHPSQIPKKEHSENRPSGLPVVSTDYVPELPLRICFLPYPRML